MNAKVQELMTRRVVTMQPHATIGHARTLLARNKIHALPVVGQAMYVPEIRANSAELRIQVTEAN